MTDTNAMRARLTGNDIWELLFGILNGDVPDEMTEEVCDQLVLALLATDRAAGVGEEALVCANCKGMIGDLPGGRDPEEFCDTCYRDTLAASPPAPADASDFSPHRWTEIVSNGLGANNAGCWRCGALSEVLARVLSLSGHDAKVIQGKANGEDHVWVQIGDTVYDPTVGQFQEPVSYQMDHVAPADASGEVAVLERALDRIGWPEIHAFQDELRKGQDIYEDAGGFMLRAIKALFGIKPKDPVITYRDAAAALVAALNPTAGAK